MKRAISTDLVTAKTNKKIASIKKEMDQLTKVNEATAAAAVPAPKLKRSETISLSSDEDEIAEIKVAVKKQPRIPLSKSRRSINVNEKFVYHLPFTSLPFAATSLL